MFRRRMGRKHSTVNESFETSPTLPLPPFATQNNNNNDNASGRTESRRPRLLRPFMLRRRGRKHRNDSDVMQGADELSKVGKVLLANSTEGNKGRQRWWRRGLRSTFGPEQVTTQPMATRETNINPYLSPQGGTIEDPEAFFSPGERLVHHNTNVLDRQHHHGLEVDEFKDITKQEEEEEERKKKPEVDLSDELIGMVIIFDSRFDLLQGNTEPACVQQTKLQQLQETQVYEDSLLGDYPEHDESFPSNMIDLLGHPSPAFVSDAISPQFWNDNSRIEAAAAAAAAAAAEEIEIIFEKEEKKEPDRRVEHEIHFFKSTEEEGFKGYETFGLPSFPSSSHQKVPSTWPLPGDSDDDTLGDEDAFCGDEFNDEFQADIKTEGAVHSNRIASPTKECLQQHPETPDLPLPRKKDTTARFPMATPYAIATTSSKSIDRPDAVVEEISTDLFSVGSGASQVAQRLVELCQNHDDKQSRLL